MNAIALPTVEDIRRDSDLFLEGTRTKEFQELTEAAMKRGFQTRKQKWIWLDWWEKSANTVQSKPVAQATSY